MSVSKKWVLLMVLVFMSRSSVAGAELREISASARAEHINVRLLAHRLGERQYRIGVFFQPDAGWHVYWKNPGDTGLAPNFEWQLPKGARLSDLYWPFPERIPIAHLINYGYHEAMVMADLHLAADSDVTDLALKLDWLVCEQSCVPGDAELALNARESNSEQQALFAYWQQRIPREFKVLKAKLSADDGTLKIELYATSLLFKGASNIQVFIENDSVVDYGKAPELRWQNNYLRLTQALSEYFTSAPESLALVIVLDHERAYRTDIPWQKAN